MYAVFLMSETLDIPGVEDQTIHVFEDEREARQFICDKLVEVGEMQYDADAAEYLVGDDCYASQQDAIDAVTYGFGSIEFFHAYKAIDHRKAEATA